MILDDIWSQTIKISNMLSMGSMLSFFLYLTRTYKRVTYNGIHINFSDTIPCKYLKNVVAVSCIKRQHQFFVGGY